MDSLTQQRQHHSALLVSATDAVTQMKAVEDMTTALLLDGALGDIMTASASDAPGYGPSGSEPVVNRR